MIRAPMVARVFLLIPSALDTRYRRERETEREREPVFSNHFNFILKQVRYYAWERIVLLRYLKIELNADLKIILLHEIIKWDAHAGC